MNNNNQEYILINKHLLQRAELKLMMKCQNRAELFGIYMMIVLHLSEADKAIGDDDDIELIHRLCGKYKKSIHDVINHYGLFDVDGERGEFQCRLLRRTMRISTSLGMDDDGTNDTNRKKSRRKVRENPEEISNFTTLIVPARDNNNNNNNILNTNETTSSSDIQRDDGDGVDCQVMDHFISDVFDDKVWMETVEREYGLRIKSDTRVRQVVMERFRTAVILKGYKPYSDSFDVAQARKYFVSWINPRLNTRIELDKAVREKLVKDGDLHDSSFIPDLADDELHRPGIYETVDDSGQRYGPHGEEVERHAVPCVDPMTRYNIHTHHWEFCKKRQS